MMERPFNPDDFTAARILTDADRQTIAERQILLVKEHNRQWPLPGLSYGAPSLRSLEGGLWYRDLGFAKVALLNRGVALLDHWSVIEQERNIPVGVLAWQCSESQIVTDRNWESTFYHTVTTEAQDEAELRLSGGLWIFKTVPAVPGFSVITNQEALRFYQRIGGVLSHVGHMSVSHITEGWVAGRSATIAFTVSGGVPPYTYTMSDDSPDWLTPSALVMDISPPVITPDGVYIGQLLVTDSNGLVVRSPVTITLGF